MTKEVYQLSDFADSKLINVSAEHPARFAVIGDPVAHSKSPQMHQAALDALSLPMRYIRVEVRKNQVRQALELMENAGFIGVNVTVPHKLEVMQACDSLTETAIALGAVNTVHFTNEGWLGHNTDGPGLALAIKSELNTTFTHSSVLVIGAGGGAGRAISVQAALDKCPKITLSNRTVEKLEPIAKKILALNPSCELTMISNDAEELINVEADLVINSTSLGMKEEDALPYPIEAISKNQKFYDAVYSPPITKLLQAAQSRGCNIANGEGMLVYQGALSFEMWLSEKPDIGLMLKQII